MKKFNDLKKTEGVLRQLTQSDSFSRFITLLPLSDHNATAH